MTDETPKLSLFKDVPGSVKTLRKSYKDRLKSIDKFTLQGELAGESDRASIILLAAILDDALTYRIGAHLTSITEQEEFEHVFRFEGPLGTFSARMEIALLFGFIENATFEQLNIIREMRNACAHSKHALVFSDSVLANVAKRILRPLGFIPIPEKGGTETLKGAFLVEGIILFHALMDGSREAARVSVQKMLQELAETASQGTQPSP